VGTAWPGSTAPTRPVSPSGRQHAGSTAWALAGLTRWHFDPGTAHRRSPALTLSGTYASAHALANTHPVPRPKSLDMCSVCGHAHTCTACPFPCLLFHVPLPEVESFLSSGKGVRRPGGPLKPPCHHHLPAATPQLRTHRKGKLRHDAVLNSSFIARSTEPGSELWQSMKERRQRVVAKRANCSLTHHPFQAGRQGLPKGINSFEPARIPLHWPAPHCCCYEPPFHLQFSKSIQSAGPPVHSGPPDLGQGSVWSCEWFLHPLHKCVVD